MQYFALLAGLAVSAVAQGVTQQISPPGGTPSSCQTSLPGTFQIGTLNATTTDGASFVPSKVKRQQGASTDGSLILSISNSVLSDLRSNGTEVGYIAANTQFQFDNPPQTGAIYTAGFSVCPLTGFPGTFVLAIGHNAIFWSCPSGNFANLYTTSQGAQCSKVYINIVNGQTGGSTTSAVSSSSKPATTAPAMTPASTPAPSAPATTPKVTQISDNQPQASTVAPKVTQISDNQPQAATQAPTATPVFNNGADSNGMSKMALAAGALAMLVL